MPWTPPKRMMDKKRVLEIYVTGRVRNLEARGETGGWPSKEPRNLCRQGVCRPPTAWDLNPQPRGWRRGMDSPDRTRHTRESGRPAHGVRGYTSHGRHDVEPANRPPTGQSEKRRPPRWPASRLGKIAREPAAG